MYHRKFTVSGGVLLLTVAFAPPVVPFETITTNARLMSLRIMKDTRNPDQDRKYRT